jgi:hypothetical protein
MFSCLARGYLVIQLENLWWSLGTKMPISETKIVFVAKKKMPRNGVKNNDSIVKFRKNN